VTRKDAAGPPYRHVLTSKYTLKDYVESGMPESSTEGSARASAQCRHMCESERVAVSSEGVPAAAAVPTYLKAGGSYEASAKGSTDFRKFRPGGSGSSDRLRV